MENGKRLPVQAIGSVRLQLVSGFTLILKDVAYVPSTRRSLISVSRWTMELFSFAFSEIEFDLILNKSSVDNGSLVGGLFCLNLAINNVAFTIA